MKTTCASDFCWPKLYKSEQQGVYPKGWVLISQLSKVGRLVWIQCTTAQPIAPCMNYAHQGTWKGGCLTSLILTVFLRLSKSIFQDRRAGQQSISQDRSTGQQSEKNFAVVLFLEDCVMSGPEAPRLAGALAQCPEIKHCSLFSRYSLLLKE